jgi:hypothetical protein
MFLSSVNSAQKYIGSITFIGIFKNDMVHGSSLSEVITREDYYLTSGGGKVGDT